MRAVLVLALLAGCKAKSSEAEPVELPTLPNGVPAACVEYRSVFEAVVACDEVPQNARTALEQSYVAIQRSWRDAAEMSSQRLRSLEGSCDQATDALRRLASTQCTLPPHVDNPVTASGLPSACLRYTQSIKRVALCDKLPQASRDALEQAFEAVSQNWSQAAPIPEARAAVEQMCRQADDAVRQAVGPMCDLDPVVEDAFDGPTLPPQCLEYRRAVFQLTRCDKLPKESRDALVQGFRALEDAWKSYKTMSPEARRAMSDGCKQGADALRDFATKTCGWDE